MKHVFQVHGVDGTGIVLVHQKLRREEVLHFFEGLAPCLVGIEACATAQHWARSLIALGHRVKLKPQTYVKPDVKRQKNDAADAEAICEAVLHCRPLRVLPSRHIPSNPTREHRQNGVLKKRPAKLSVI